MERIPVPESIEVETANVLTGIMDAAAPLPIVLDAAPSTSNRDLKEGQVGFFGGFKYETINGITYKYAVTAV